jgi:twinkle protein
MGKIVTRNKPCLDVTGCGSHDARQIYEKGDSFCFSCHKWFPPESGEVVTETNVHKKITVEEIETLPSKGLKDREIETAVMKFFDVRVSLSEEDGKTITAHYYPYEENAYKVRKLPKDFYWVNKSQKLFGQIKFNAAGKRLVITEGEIDALSVAQTWYSRYKKIYPVVSLSSSTGTKALIEQRDWVRSFEEVILCLDEDTAGRKALEECIKIIGVDKVKIAKLPLKDANEVLVQKGWKDLLSCIYDAAPYLPSGIITKEELWAALENYNSIPAVPYPPCLEGVNTKLKGMRPGEITLFISGTGSGKSTILREIMLHVLATTSDKIGVVSLEEAPAETARKLAGMILKRNPAKEEIPLTDLKVGFDEVFGTSRVILLDHQGAIDDASIIDKLEYMCLNGARYLFIDHITILVSEGMENLTGNEAQDKIMNGLLKLVKRHPVWIGLVSHLRKSSGGGKSFEEGRLPSIDDIRGSGSIKQISFDVISFSRHLTATSEQERNTIKMQILKARHTGLTGSVIGARYSYDTGRLTACSDGDTFIEEKFVSV